MIQEVIVSILSGLVRVFNVTRDSLAKNLEEIAADVRSGKLIPQETFDRAKADKSKVDDAYNNLPD